MEKPEIIRRSIEDSATGELSPSELFNKIVKNYFDDEDDSEDDNFDYNDFSVNFNEEAHSFVDGPSSSNRFYPNLKVFKKKLFKTLNLPSFKWTLRSSIQCEIQKEDRLKVFGVTSPQKLLQLMPPPSNELIDFKSRCVSPDLFSSHFNGDTNFVQSVQNALNAMKRNSKTNVAADSEKVMKKILQDLEENGAASISVVKNEEWENSEVSNGILCQKDRSYLTYRRVNSESLKSKKHFAIIMYVLSEVYNLLTSGLTCTERELYYKEAELIANQAALHYAITDVCNILNASPWELGIRQSCKGLICGAIRMHMSDDSIIDCYFNDRPTLIPNDIKKITYLETTAKFVLIVEKDTIFQKFILQNILVNLRTNIILITGKGYPDVATRLMVKRIWNDFHLPTYVLVDADPFGIEIMFVYRYGSKAMAHSSDRMACPNIRWIGIQPSEIELLAIPTAPQSRKDKKKIIELLQRTYINNEIRNELEILKRLNRKAEIEAVAAFSQNFLLYTYLRCKLKRNLVI